MTTKIKCDKCNGTGIGESNYYACDKCLGTKELDWVENIIGKLKPWSGFFVVNLTNEFLYIDDLGTYMISPMEALNLEMISPMEDILRSDDLKNLINSNKVCIIDQTGYLDETK